MKRVFLYLIAVIALSACTTTNRLTPTEMKAISTKQFESNYDVVFRSVISLLQSEGALVEDTDRETGLIKAVKRIEKKAFGYSENASISKIGFYIDAINDELTEVKLTIYEGTSKKTAAWASSYGQQQTQNKEAIVQDPVVYQTWFNNLRAEIERRKATR